MRLEVCLNEYLHRLLTGVHFDPQRRIAALRMHLASLLQRERFDVLHAHDGIGANALADLVQQGAIDGYLRTVHHVDRFGDARVQAWEERSIRAAARVLCVSALWCRRLRSEGRVRLVRSSMPHPASSARLSST